jgi:hypothetical protein
MPASAARWVGPTKKAAPILARQSAQCITIRWVAKMEPYLLTEEHAEAAANTFPAAFIPSPPVTFVVPDRARRT